MRKYLLGVICLGASAGLQAQTMESMQVEDVPQVRRTSIEINPFTAALNAIPGVGAVSGSVEGYLGDKWAGFVDFSYADVELRNDWVTEAQEETNEPIVDDGFGYTAGVGLRYYEDPIGDSFYGAGLVSYGEAQADWTYEDEVLSSEIYTVTPALSAGYRWVWNNGVLLRLGAGASAPFLVGESITGSGGNATAQDARTKIEDIQDQQVLAKVDLGLGYSW